MSFDDEIRRLAEAQSKYRAKSLIEMVGRPFDELTTLWETEKRIFDETADQGTLDSNVNIYFGEMKIRPKDWDGGDISATIKFGDGQVWRFDAHYTGFCARSWSGNGGGPWIDGYIAPQSGEVMGFAFAYGLIPFGLGWSNWAEDVTPQTVLGSFFTNDYKWAGEGIGQGIWRPN